MRRIALFSDIHANLTALEAVLADIDANDLEERYCLGDLIGYGPDPHGVVDRIRASGIPAIQGNYDEGVASHRGSCGCYYATEQARSDGDRSYAYTSELLASGDDEWLLSLPLDIRLEHDGVRILLVHGSPRKINEYLLPDRTDEQLARLAREAEADLVCHGHIHLAYHRSFPDPESNDALIHYVSSGSVGKPKDGDSRAGWVELVLGSAEEVGAVTSDDEARAPVGASAVWAGVVVHRVGYDIEAVATAMRQQEAPERLVQALRDA